MALNGTLADFGVVDLIQFPNKGRRTGELVVAGTDMEARLYYVEGNLVHAAAGNLNGMDALIEVVSWADGEFEFRNGVEESARTLELDLHRALMLALKTRDERMEEVRKHQARTEHSRLDGRKAQQLLEALIEKMPHLQGACLLADDGSPVAESESDEAEKGRLAHVRDIFGELYKKYRDGRLARTFFEDDLGVVHGSRLDGRGIAVIVANSETSMGQLSLTMNRLATALDEIEG